MKKRNYLSAIILLFIILLPGFCLDTIYHYSELWKLSSTVLGQFCIMINQMGFSYSSAFGMLRSNFGILITAISVIVTMGINISNRSESRVFGLSRKALVFSERTRIYQYGHIMIFAAPVLMVIAINLEYCITGYLILSFSYLFLVLCYVLFDSSFSADKDKESVVKKLLGSIPDSMQEAEDISAYLLHLNDMRQWSDKEKNWEGIEQLFLDICDEIKKYDVTKMYVFGYYFFDIVFVRKGNENSGRAVRALKNYMDCMYKPEWNEKRDAYYLILWGMLKCLLNGCPQEEMVYFLKWYMDYPERSKKVLRHKGHPIDESDEQKQMGILLIEIESYLNNNSQINSYILESLPAIWTGGKYFLGEQEESFVKDYLSINEIYGLGTHGIVENIKNLYSDYRDGTARSVIVTLLSYKLEEDNEHNMQGYNFY